jgi:hypothetical protein
VEVGGGGWGKGRDTKISEERPLRQEVHPPIFSFVLRTLKLDFIVFSSNLLFTSQASDREISCVMIRQTLNG